MALLGVCSDGGWLAVARVIDFRFPRLRAGGRGAGDCGEIGDAGVGEGDEDDDSGDDDGDEADDDTDADEADDDRD